MKFEIIKNDDPLFEYTTIVTNSEGDWELDTSITLCGARRKIKKLQKKLIKRKMGLNIIEYGEIK